MFGWW